jgi:CRISPR-associated protein Cas1
VGLPVDKTPALDTWSDDTEWAARSEYWLNYQPQAKRGRPKKFKYREPLILCGHGVKIRVDHGTLLIHNGFTHYPQKQEIHRVFPGDPDLPNRITMLDGSGGITLDAMTWMAEQNIEFLKLDWRGEVTSYGGNLGYSANPKLVKIQREITGNKKQVEIARQLITEKIDNSISTLIEILPKSENREKATSGLRSYLVQVQSPRKIRTIQQILGTEGIAAATYFRAWQGISLSWTGTGRKPIPSSWREIGPRMMSWRDCAKNARHPINAMLNYGYGILKFQIRAQITVAGLDPSIGILHGNSENRIPLVYDFMEPSRPIIDRCVLEYSLSHKFTPADFTINKWGGCRLNPQTAKSLVAALARTDSGRIGDIMRML